VEEVAQELFLMRLEAPDLARSSAAGQFVMVRCLPSNETVNDFLFLRRPLALHGIRPDQGEVSLLFQRSGRGTGALAETRPGTALDVLGPLGKPVKLPSGARHIVFMAGGLGIASLTALLDQGAAKGWRMTLLAGARTSWRLYPSRLLPSGVREMTATDDGSAGVRAPVTHLLPQVQEDGDLLIACGPTPMLRALARMRKDGLLTIPTLLLLESRMGCGFGACMGCTVATKEGVRLVCTQGPAFDLDAIVWDDPLAPSL
jgi:dihydroorotate dehydrogenase electron transfer subunit